MADATYSVVGTEVFDSYDQNLTKIQDVLIIELKKGKSAIGRDEMNQADGYIQDFLGSGAMDGTPMFRAYVVGYEIQPKTSKEKRSRKRVFFVDAWLQPPMGSLPAQRTNAFSSSRRRSRRDTMIFQALI